MLLFAPVPLNFDFLEASFPFLNMSMFYLGFSIFFVLAFLISTFQCKPPVDPLVSGEGIKGKTWGPSTCHQRERGQIITRVTDTAGHKRWSKSAPNLEKHTAARSAATGLPTYGALQEIGRMGEGVGDEECQQGRTSRACSENNISVDAESRWHNSFTRSYR